MPWRCRTISSKNILHSKPNFGASWVLSGKESAYNAGDLGLIPGLGRSPGEGNDYLLQYSCPENSMGGGGGGTKVLGVSQSWTRLRTTTLHFWWVRVVKNISRNKHSLLCFKGPPWWLSGKDSTCQFMRYEFDPWVQKVPWRRK